LQAVFCRILLIRKGVRCPQPELPRLRGIPSIDVKRI
jgi:hypothetical protein